MNTSENQKESIIEVLKPSLRPDTKQTITFEEKEYDFYSDHEPDTNYFPEGVPIQQAEDYFSFSQKIFQLREYFDGSTPERSTDLIPLIFYGFNDSTVHITNQEYTGIFRAVYKDATNKLNMFEIKYHNDDDHKEIYDDITIQELK